MKKYSRLAYFIIWSRNTNKNTWLQQHLKNEKGAELLRDESIREGDRSKTNWVDRETSPSSLGCDN